MRRVLTAAAATVALLIGTGGAAWADPPTSPVPDRLPSGWSLDDDKLVWTAPRPVPMGDAAVEFWSGDRLLGRARGAADQRTFRMPVPDDTDDLSVRAAGKRLDAAAPPQRRKGTAPAALPPPSPAGELDPGAPGPYATTTGEYDLPSAKLPDFPADVEMRGVVVAPTNAPGPRPLALFLHGRHYTCYQGDDPDKITGDWPCPEGLTEVPSYRGYLQSQQLLASQGYVTVSISANGINGQDFAADDGGAQARSSLVRLHLAQWAARNPAIARVAPQADLSKVFLVGHSRGGEGVNRAAMDTLNPPPAAVDGYHGKVGWTIRGTLLIGPTIFGHDPVPDVPSATILPGCDGDVSDLQGQIFVDGTRGVGNGKALHSALLFVGANHNYFNTEWTPGQSAAPSFDDFFTDPGAPDPLCSPGTPTRLTERQQQTAGATYIATAARLFVAGDDRARPLLDGTGVRAPSADPARVLSHAVGAGRTPAILPDARPAVTGGKLCLQVAADPADACLVNEDFSGGSPHFTPFFVVSPEEGRYAVRVDGPATVRPAKPASLAGASDLAVRLIVPPNTTGRFGLSASSPGGKTFDLGDVTVEGAPGSESTSSYWAREVRVERPKGLTSLASLSVTPRQAGPSWLIDAWGFRPGTPAPSATALSRIDVGEIEATEGDSGTATYQVPVAVKGKAGGKVRLFLVDPDTFSARSWVADVRPGSSRIDVPVEVTGNDTYGGSERWYVLAKAVRNTMVGDYEGGVDVREDDPRPDITVTPASVTAAEGGSLTWTINLSAAAEVPIYLIFLPQPTEAELSSTDVDPEWFTGNSGESYEPSRALSSTGLQPFVEVEAGTTTAQLIMPTVSDDAAEGAENVRWQATVYNFDTGELEPLSVVNGTLTD
ncbi:hypothetical protein AB0M54_13850 [Actinoplanes sp. NPDC051470]|uniref:hypothetical protein n=1 Tax=Actinoplanes sp. NPDC051470 TaxID=3157224 RepID=UPI00342AD7E9